MKTLELIVLQNNIEFGVQLIVLWQPVHYILTDLLLSQKKSLKTLHNTEPVQNKNNYQR